MKYPQAVEYLESLNQYGIVPGLDNISNLCEKLGNPQNDLKFVHIAGTNGKGSVLAYVSTILKTAGYKVGRYISPVIFEYREKIQINNRPITQKAICSLAERMQNICAELVKEGKNHPTSFEVETAMAFSYFKEQGCDIVVMETGMGGEEDATNMIENTLVAVLSSISMDHMQYLGTDLASITSRKAGIFKPGCHVVTIKQQKESMQVIEKQCEKLSLELTIADGSKAKNVRYGLERQRFQYENYKELVISLTGKHQVDNAVLAIEVIEALRKKAFLVSDKDIYTGLKETRWHGRFSVVGKKPYFVIDGAHNEDAAKKLAESIEFYFTNRRIIYIMGILRDKEYHKIIELTHKYADQILTVTTPNQTRTLTAYELATEVAKIHPNVTAADSLEEAVELAYLLARKEDVIIAFGSLSFTGKLINILENRKA